ncbi:MAG: primosomal protein N' [Marmoricola sp.]
MPPPEQSEQPALLSREEARASARAARGRPAAAAARELATHNPVARVLVDVPLAHLDRPFDYAVPEPMTATAVAGARVKVRFAGQDVDGFVVERAETSDHAGRLQPLRRVVSPEPVLTPEVAALSDAVAQRYAGTRSDVLRLAVPPRHAGAEKRPSEPAPAGAVAPDPAAWDDYDGGPAYLEALGTGGCPRAVMSVLPGDDAMALLAEAVVATAASERGVVVCLPDVRDVARLDAALTTRLGSGRHVVLTADLGPSRRYRAFLAIARGAVRIVIGTRAAAFAPVHDLGLVAIWDDGDDLHEEPRAPYPHAREVLLTRAGLEETGVLVAAHARSVEAQYLVRTGWAREVVASRATTRRRLLVSVTGDTDADLARDPLARSVRLPHEVFETTRGALASGPVLVQTPRAGYATRLVCSRCRTPAACAVCSGPLRITARERAPECAWCATPARGRRCPECGGAGLRAPVVGDRRTAEELGRAFPGTPVRTSSGDAVHATVPAIPALVVATPGAEPVADGGYAAVLLLDTWLSLARADLRAPEEALRRWTNAAALARPGGRVVAVGDPSSMALQALVRWDPATFAEREILDRQSAHLPPASRVAVVAGAPQEVEPAVEALRAPGALPPGTEVLGPVLEDGGAVPARPAADEPRLRYLLRSPRAQGPALSAALRQMQSQRAARKLPHLRVEVDPAALG